MSLNLPPVHRKSKGSNAEGIRVKKVSLSASDVDKLQQIGADRDTVKSILDCISYSLPLRFSLPRYMISAALAGVRPQDFVCIAAAGVLENPPNITVLYQYVNSHPDIEVAMLGYRLNMSAEEITKNINNPDFTKENLLAMLDLSR